MGVHSWLFALKKRRLLRKRSDRFVTGHLVFRKKREEIDNEVQLQKIICSFCSCYDVCPGGINDQKVAYTAGVPASSSAAARTVTGHARTNIITAAKRTDNFLQLYFIIDFLPLFS